MAAFPPTTHKNHSWCLGSNKFSLVRPCSSSANSLHWRLRYLSVLTGIFIKWSLAPLWDGINKDVSASWITKKTPNHAASQGGDLQVHGMKLPTKAVETPLSKMFPGHYTKHVGLHSWSFLHTNVFLYTSTLNVWDYLAAAWDSSKNHLILKESPHCEHAQSQWKCFLSETPDQCWNVPLKILGC